MMREGAMDNSRGEVSISVKKIDIPSLLLKSP